MKMRKNIVATGVIMLVSLFTLGQGGAPSLAPPSLQQEMNLAEAMLIDAAARIDLPALKFAKERFQALTAEPALAVDAYYFSAFAAWQLGMNHFAEPEKAKAYLADGFANLEKIFQKETDHADSRLLMLRLYYWKSQLEPEKAQEIWPIYGQALTKVRELLPEHPVTKLNLGLAVYYAPNGDKARGIGLMEDSVKTFAAKTDRNDPHGVFWYMLGSAWLGNHYMMDETPRIEDARAVYERALAVRPDFALIRDTMMPATETLVACAADEVAGKRWHTLAEDGEGDTADATLADGKGLSYTYDAEKDMLWFRFSFHRMPSSNGFGVNLVADVDGDQTNGTPWWGGNRDFRFDRLFSVWVARGKSGDLTGTVGIGAARDVMQGRMTGLARNNIAFTRDDEAKTITIGFQRKWLGDKDKVRFIGAVGSNNRWNDDLPDKEVLRLDLADLM